MRETIHIRMPDQLVDAIAAAAARRFQTVSEFTRQALLDRLRADGLDPARRWRTESSMGDQHGSSSTKTEADH